jgi:DNA-binding XRE family transcriptional regulator
MTKRELRAARKKLGMTQVELATALGMRKGAILRMEGGARPIMRVTELAIQHLLLMSKKKRRK